MFATIDTQIKIFVEDFDQLMKKMHNLEGIFIGGTFEKTIRYDNENSTYENKGIFIRTKSGFNNVVTIKEKEESDIEVDYFHRLKTEFEIEDIESMEYIFSKIGLNKQLILEKYRLLWQIKNTTISIDELPFGIYLEIKGSNEQIEEIIKLLEYEDKPIINQTYWDIFYELKKHGEYLDADDIRFPNNYLFKIAQ